MLFWERSVISFGKAQAIFEAGVDALVLDCFFKADSSRERSEPWSDTAGRRRLSRRSIKPAVRAEKMK